MNGCSLAQSLCTPHVAHWKLSHVPDLSAARRLCRPIIHWSAPGSAGWRQSGGNADRHSVAACTGTVTLFPSARLAAVNGSGTVCSGLQIAKFWGRVGNKCSASKNYGGWAAAVSQLNCLLLVWSFRHDCCTPPSRCIPGSAFFFAEKNQAKIHESYLSSLLLQFG